MDHLKHRLPKLLLRRLRKREITTKAAAEELGVNASYLSTLLAKLGFAKDPATTSSNRKEAAEARAERLANLQDIARRLYKNEIDITQACELGNCSDRTIYRHLAKVVGSVRGKRKPQWLV
jgi:AraC-like DNA-binding protein